MSNPFDEAFDAAKAAAPKRRTRPAPDETPADLSAPDGFAQRLAEAKADGWLEAGEHDNVGERYHLDPCVQPSLSSSIAKVMVERSPWHAWTAHPRLNPDFEVKDKAIWRGGRAFHTMLLGAGAPIRVCDFDAWRSNEAKAARQEAIDAGETPLLQKEYDNLLPMVRAVRRQINAREELAYAMQGGIPERTYVWLEETEFGPIWCRMMIDWTPHRGNYLVDWKTTGAGAGPNQWGARTIWDTGCDIQDAFYRRGFEKVTGQSFDAVCFAVAETEPPYALMHHRVDPEAQAQAEREVEWAIRAWARCLHSNRWPGYPTHMAWQTKPGWRTQNYEVRAANGLNDPAQVEAVLAAAEAIKAVQPQDGAEVTRSNPLGLTPEGA